MANDKSREQEKRLREEIEKRHGKTVEELYEERQKRYRDAVELREPDRVPVTLSAGVFAARQAGLTASAMYYDHAAYREACMKTILEYEPDLCWAMGTVNSGLTLELLDARHHRWPGGTLLPDVPYQYVEGEYMKADEYDIFLSDPSDFMMRYYLPRLYGALEPLSSLPPFRSAVGGYGFMATVGLLVKPEFQELAKKIYKAGTELERLRGEWFDFLDKLTRLGFPTEKFGGAIGSAPFDTIADYLRGMRGIMIDMFRRPDDLLAACDKVLERGMEQATPATSNGGDNISWQGMPLHRASDGFMSLEQFEKFYWPTLKKTILFNVDMGYVVWLFCEGVWDARLDYLLELPKGKVVCAFEKTDMFKAKEVLGGHLCIQGNVPPTLLEFGTPQQVEEYCQKLIKVCGKGGGFILSPGSSNDQATPENVRAMVDSVKNM